ncbi:hypothetical protein HHK36_018280 [Tetracentron sinense]|uniref:GST N-terminal domain-containing protein n=1 Tax=Tetracentron sinense TaxID=13715 RepID=A0A834Z167_TETSI|nr:hypothetical protein HHK36_018280 [Tetracentron sinense]
MAALIVSHKLSSCLTSPQDLSKCCPSINSTRPPSFQAFSCLHRLYRFSSKKTRARITAMASGIVQEILPPVLDSTSDPPSLFDGTTRLYTSYICPYAQRVWIIRNYKSFLAECFFTYSYFCEEQGLQDKIKLVPIDLQNRPAWYKEKVYPTNKVPSLEHNNEIKGESLDLLKYIDSHFEGPMLFPEDPAKIEFAEELLTYTDTFSGAVITSLKGDSEKELSAPFDYLETALSKFDDGHFFLGQFSLVDIAYAPFIERFQPLALDLKKYDITTGRPKLVSWIEEINKIEAYKQTKRDPHELISILKKHLFVIPLHCTFEINLNSLYSC